MNINNKSFYKKKLEINNFKTYISKYFTILDNFVTTLKKRKEINKKLYIIDKGVNALHFIYNILLMYTKNIELANFHLQKSSVYFIEFILQITDLTELSFNMTFKDAIIFLYKKTIFKIDKKYTEKLNENEKINIYILYDATLCINMLLEYNCNNTKIKKIINNFFCKTDVSSSLHSRIRLFLHFLKWIDIDKNSNKFYKIIILFLKNIKKKNISKNKLLKNMIFHKNIIDNISSVKYINLLLKD